MTLEWAQQESDKKMKAVLKAQEELIEFVSSLSFLTDEEKEIINNRTREILDGDEQLGYFMPYFYTFCNIEEKYKNQKDVDKFTNLFCLNNILDNSESKERVKFKDTFPDELNEKGIFHNEYLRLLRWDNPKWSFNYVDIGPYEFDGDIVITDPCYVIDRDAEGIDYYDTEALMKSGKFRQGMSNSTLYGDWGCTTFDTKIEGKIYGEFGADSGMVCVLYLDDIKKVSPEGYEWLMNKESSASWSATIIRNFKGTVTFEIKEEHYEFEGEDCIDYVLEVIGHGIDKKTGEEINFKGTQTSL